MGSFPDAEVRGALDRYVALREQIENGAAPWTDIADMFTEDAVFVDPAWGRVEGRERIRHLFATAMPGVDFKYPIDFVATSGEWAVVKWRQVLPGTRADGRTYEQTGVTLLWYGGDGRFRFEEDVLNMVHAVEDVVESGWMPGEGFVAPPEHPDRDTDPLPKSSS